MSKKTTFIATGDSFITRRLSSQGYTGFDEVREIIEACDVRFNNLEMTVHNQEGFPAAASGGTWAMAQPEVLDDLTRYGFNLFNTANNHSCDYSHGGGLATIRNLQERNLVFAGTGKNLAEAAAPAYLEVKDARVALIAVSSTFREAAPAGNQSPYVIGRPGLNPLRFKKTIHVTKEHYEALQQIENATQLDADKLRVIRNGYELPPPAGQLYFAQMNFQLDTVNKIRTEPLEKDMKRVIAAVEEARRQADYVLISVHSHDGEPTMPAEFLQIFCRTCIDRGADAILGHGPHELRGIEIYKGKPIFYSLGNFIFQTETVALQPADAYEKVNMPHNTQVGEFMNNRNKGGTVGYIIQPNIWRSVMAQFTAEDGKITEVKLHPITLNMGAARSRMGWPCLLHDNDVLEYLQTLSEPFGTQFEIQNGVATIKLG